MSNSSSIRGVFAAAVTPLNRDLSPDLDGLVALIRFLAQRGCHGVLVLGTTGEGPSFSIKERLAIYKAAASLKPELPELKILAGTGTPSLEDTVYLTRSAFDLGMDSTVTLPPYYFRKATDDGLFSWFSHVINTAVPKDMGIFGYHFPSVSGVGLSLELLGRLKDAFPSQFLGIKDSSGDSDWARSLGNKFGEDLKVLTGNDRLLSLALNNHASGCITAMANLLSPIHRQIWDSFQGNNLDEKAQEKLNRGREVMDRNQPFPPVIKMILSRAHGFPSWKVKPPLIDFDDRLSESVTSEFLSASE